MQTHEAMISSYFGRYKFSACQTGDRVACNILFTWEFLRPLLTGGTVYVIPDDVIFLPRSLTRYISEKPHHRSIVYSVSLASDLEFV